MAQQIDLFDEQMLFSVLDIEQTFIKYKNFTLN